MLELKDFMPINFLKKEKFTGSHKGLRFRMEKLEENEETFLFVSVWPEPYSYDFTPEEEKEHLKPTFDADGIARGVDWINETSDRKKGAVESGASSSDLIRFT